MEKKDLLKAVESLKKEIEDGKVTDFIAFGRRKTGTASHVCTDPIIGLGLAKKGEMELEENIQNQEKANDFSRFLKAMTSDDSEEGDN